MYLVIVHCYILKHKYLYTCHSLAQCSFHIPNLRLFDLSHIIYILTLIAPHGPSLSTMFSHEEFSRMEVVCLFMTLVTKGVHYIRSTCG